tara:strand:+ start:755 stop:961 length:207 start_codon:yes stop_codon:yes gene_type:complete
MLISVKNYMEATGVVPETAGRRLKGRLYYPGANGTRLYGVAAALPTLWTREEAKGPAETLVGLAKGRS